MKIAYLSRSRLPSVTANSIQVAKMCAAFSSIHQVKLVCFEGPENQRQEKLEEIYGLEKALDIYFCPWFKSRIFRQLSLLRGVLQVISEVKPDLAYARDLFSAVVASSYRTRVIVELHDVPSSFISRQLLKVLLRSRYLLHIVVISQQLRLDLQESLSLETVNILVAPDGANAVPIGYSISQKKTDFGSFQVAYVGSLTIGKGIELISDLAPRAPWATFNIFGGTPPEINYWRRGREVSPNLVFHGRINHADVHPTLVTMDTVLLPNQREVRPFGNKGNIGAWTSPLKLFEYMASGVPIIASSIDVLREILEDNYNALLCDPRNPQEWQEALELLRRYPEKGAELASRARGDLEQRYTWEKRAQFVLANFS